ncbi:atg9b [Bugula neritina]|uniref:Autophagy-related protein 9 n=1 Tax=Bugula neritina TaxID=10212 RepID=A0A7J7KIJ1_BUGNE|nr:atg9b [Bugula neritina]
MALQDYSTGYDAYQTDTEDELASHPFVESDGVYHENTPLEQWRGIQNLDDFFRRVYTYHWRHGFICMCVEDVLQLIQFLWLVLLSGFLVDCVDYGILFATRTPTTKQTFEDVFITPCSCGFSVPIVALCMVIAFGFLLIRVVMVTRNIFKYWQIRKFYLVALQIPSNELDNTKWNEVQEKLMQVQRDVNMCIYKTEVTQLDISNRILRYKNFFISMINKSILPLSIQVPFVGKVWYLTHGLKFNLEWILFWMPGWNISPFKNPYHVKDEYKNAHKRIALARQLSTKILVLGVVNLVLCPIIFLWHILYFLFVYGNMVKRDPGFLGSRRWSLYSRAYLRHFNELDHELDMRLCQAYQPSSDYVNSFMSPLPAILGRFVTFVFGAVLFVLVVLTWYDEDVLQIQHMITLMGGIGMVLSISTMLIPPENMVFDPNTKMTQVLSHIHYHPNHWKDKAHTSQVRDEFGELFQFKGTALLQELLSPLITPLILIFKVRHSSLEIVDFYRNFTVDVSGVGDVCSFAQMNIRKHGNKKWSSAGKTTTETHQQAEHGKTELSLVHFSIMNPTWQPPEAAERYLQDIQKSFRQDKQSPSGLHLPPLSPPPVTQSLSSLHSYSDKTGSQMPRSDSYVVTESSPGNRNTHSSNYDSSDMGVSMLYMHELRQQDRLTNMGQIGDESLTEVRHFMTDSELHPVNEYHSYTDSYGATSSAPYSNQPSTSQNV